MNKSQVQKIIKNQLFFGVNEIRTNNANIDKKIFGRKTNNSKTLFTENNLDIKNDLIVHGNVSINQSLKLNYGNIIDVSGTISNPLLPMYVIDCSGSGSNLSINLPLPDFDGQILHMVCIAEGHDISINYTDILGTTPLNTSGASTVFKFIGIKNTTSTPPRNGWIVT